MSKIQTVIARLEKLSKNLPLIAGNVVVNESQENFRREGFYSQKTWKPISAAYAKRKDSVSTIGGILTDTGRLRLSIRITRRTADFVAVGTDVPYARRHNEGIRMPKRQFLGSHPKQAKAISDEIVELFRRAFR